MRSVVEEISEQDYDLYRNDYAKFREKIENDIPQSWVAGYGWYGCTAYKDEDKYYVKHWLGNSCD